MSPAATAEIKQVIPRLSSSGIHAEAQALQKDWATNPRWEGVIRTYGAEDVLRLRGSLKEANTLAHHAAGRFWDLIHGGAKKGYVNALGALSGGQAVQMAKAGLEAIYVSGWQVAADNNTSLSMYPDQSLYAVDSVPRLVKCINNSLRRADQIQWSKTVMQPAKPLGSGATCAALEGSSAAPLDYFVPVVADAEAGFGGVLNAYELVKHLIEAGVGGIHLEDQLASAKKCGHLGGKVLVPTSEAVQKLIAARLAADVAGVPTVIIARTDADAANLITSDHDPNDKAFLTGERAADGFYSTKAGIGQAISRGLAYGAYADVLWCETSTPNIANAAKFARAIHAQFPGKCLAYNCSPSFNWKKNLTNEEIEEFQVDLCKLGYTFQFITLAGIHSMWYNTFDLAHDYARGEGMKHYVEKVQQKEFEAMRKGYTFVAHQQEVGTGYFDDLINVVQQGRATTCAMKGSTEEAQF